MHTHTHSQSLQPTHQPQQSSSTSNVRVWLAKEPHGPAGGSACARGDCSEGAHAVANEEVRQAEEMHGQERVARGKAYHQAAAAMSGGKRALDRDEKR
jgi:hypothetical protein